MHTQVTSPRYLALLVLLAISAFCGATDITKKPLPLPPEIVKAWQDAGAVVGCMKDIPSRPPGGDGFWEPWRENIEVGAIAAFRFPSEKGDDLETLPDPGMAFGLSYRCRGVAAVWLKKLARLKSLRSLNVGGSLTLNDEKLQELAALKDLHALYLYHAAVTDAGLKYLAGLKSLQVLDLSSTRVTDTGLKELAELKHLQALNLTQTRVTDAGLKTLAGLKSLRWLSLRRTKVTAAGVAALRKELPGCNITSGDD